MKKEGILYTSIYTVIFFIFKLIADMFQLNNTWFVVLAVIISSLISTAVSKNIK